MIYVKKKQISDQRKSSWIKRDTTCDGVNSSKRHNNP